MLESERILEGKLGFDRIREMICSHCQSEFASALTGGEEFSSDEYEIRHRLLLTEEMRLILMFEDNFPTSGYIDSVDFLLPLQQENTSIDILALRKFKTMLETLSKVSSFFERAQKGMYPNLKKMSGGIADFSIIAHKIDTLLDRYGNIRDNASEELLAIRKDKAAKEGAVSKRAAAVLHRAQQDGIVDDSAAVAIRDGRMLIPVPATAKHQLKGFIYDESASGKTAFIEPAEVVELTNEIRELEFAEQREIVRILFNFSEFVRPYIDELLKASRFMGTMDFLIAKATVALDMAAGMPVFSSDGCVRLRKARNPLLEKALKRENRTMVPLTLTLSPQKRILLISGPNAGGKSVCLKTMGLLQYMFQWGMLIPTSETSEMLVFDRIDAVIGDDQNIDNDLSTYSSFLANMKTVLETASEKSLVLIDEFGSGTEPAAGGAIAEALLARLESAGIYGVITTHYTNLKMYASRGESAVVNGAMAFDGQKLQPLFKLEMGLPGNSFAFEMARKMGLPEEIVKDAELRAGDGFVGMERNLRKIARSRKALDEKLERVSKADRTLTDITDRYQKELSDIKQLKKQIIEDAQQEARSIVEGANKQVEATIRTIKEAQADKQKTIEARKELQGFLGDLTQAKARHDEYVERKLAQLEARKERNEQRRRQRAAQAESAASAEEAARNAREEEFRNAPLSVGEKVRIKENGMVGEVAKVGGNNIIVLVGNLSTKIAAGRVERITSNEYKTAVKEVSRPAFSTIVTDASIRERKLNFHPEIDLRGERLQDAIEKVMHYVDDAIMLGVPQVRIIHGKGTGVLHEEIQKYLRTTPGVATVSDEHVQFGGSGVTIVTFE